jgi:hypothetical protein
LVALAFVGFAPVSRASKPPLAPIKVHVSLLTQKVIAGQVIKGTVVLTNTSEKAITVDTCAIDGWLAVGLSGKVNSYPFGHYAVSCAPSVRLKPGINRHPVRIITTYASCTQPEPSGSSPSPLSPNCTVSRGQMSPPPLPAGTYLTKVDIVGLDGLIRAPNRVVVSLRAPARPPKLGPCAETPATTPTLVTVPDVVGDSSSAAALVLSDACLNAGYASPVGHQVMTEAPTAGSKVPEYSTVTLTTR